MPGKNSNAGKVGLFGRLHSKSASREDLQAAAQLAVQVEFTTIPPYLTALYSISDKDSYAYQALRSVVMEEMFHINQSANILVALGGQPRFTGQYAPSYPTYLPHANPDTTPFIQLCRASTAVFDDIFSAIETPAAPGAPPQGDNYDSIAQLYQALEVAVAAYPGNPFEADPPTYRQRTDIYLGKFGGTVIKVSDKESAVAAVTEIVQQGEGTVPATKPLIPIEQYGAYNHYGQRTDGTYGPITGTPYEMSHFIKFRKISLDSVNFPDTLPIVSNARIEEYSNPDAVEKAHLFNKHYSVMLHALEQTFQRPSRQNPVDPYFGVVLTLMHQVLPNLARALMTTPASLNGNKDVGPNAAPTWTYTPNVKLSDLPGAIAGVMNSVHKTAKDTAARDAALAPLEAALKGLHTVMAGAAELAL
jgi:hypothetical protein